MPTKPNAVKALRQSRKRASINRAKKAALKKLVKTARRAIAKKEGDVSPSIAAAVKALDRAAQKKLIKKNTASRLKSRLTKQRTVAPNAAAEKTPA